MNIRIFARILLFSLCVFNATAMNEQAKQHVPYIYNYFRQSGSKRCNEINLFITVECHFCHDSLRQLFDYLKQRPEICVKIYLFPRYEEDKEKILYLIAAYEDLDQFWELSSIFANPRHKNLKKDKKFMAFLKKYPAVEKRYQQNQVQYIIWAKKMEEKFYKMQVDKAPTWVVNNEHTIEGEIRNIKEVVVLFDKVA